MQPGQPLGPAGQRSRHLVTTAQAVLAVLDPICLGGLGEQLGHLGLEVSVGAVGRRGGVGLDLGDVHIIRSAVAAQDPEGDVLVAAAFDLVGGTDAGAAAISRSLSNRFCTRLVRVKGWAGSLRTRDH